MYMSFLEWMKQGLLKTLLLLPEDYVKDSNIFFQSNGIKHTNNQSPINQCTEFPLEGIEHLYFSLPLVGVECS